MAVIRAGRAFVAIVLEGDEWTGGRAVDEGQAAFRHRGDDTRHTTRHEMTGITATIEP
jgi:hypothetical protein